MQPRNVGRGLLPRGKALANAVGHVFSLSRRFLYLQIVAPDSIIWNMPVATPVKNDTVMSTREAAEYLGLAENTVRQYLNRGIMNAVKIGPVWCVMRSECDRYNSEKREPGRPSED